MVREKPVTLALPFMILSTHSANANLAWTDLGSNPGLRLTLLMYRILHIKVSSYLTESSISVIGTNRLILCRVNECLGTVTKTNKRTQVYENIL